MKMLLLMKLILYTEQVPLRLKNCYGNKNDETSQRDDSTHIILY